MFLNLLTSVVVMLYQTGDAYYNLDVATVEFNNYELSITYESQH
jgi:hypothetical protein